MQSLAAPIQGAKFIPAIFRAGQAIVVGDPKYKKHIRIYSYEEADWDYLKDLIVASSRFDPYSLKEHPT